jgi:hypothetical protein
VIAGVVGEAAGASIAIGISGATVGCVGNAAGFAVVLGESSWHLNPEVVAHAVFVRAKPPAVTCVLAPPPKVASVEAPF